MGIEVSYFVFWTKSVLKIYLKIKPDVLLVRLVVEKTDENDSHVVATKTAHVVVCGKATGHQFFANYLGLHPVGYPSHHKVSYFLQSKYQRFLR